MATTATAAVRNVPDETRLREVEEAFPGSEIQLHVEEGMQLSESSHSDAYSYELGAIFHRGAVARGAQARLRQAVGTRSA